MEEQAKYQVKSADRNPLDPEHEKDRPFHGDYLQGKRPQQYETAAVCLGYALGLIIGLAFIFACFFLGRWLIEFIQAL